VTRQDFTYVLEGMRESDCEKFEDYCTSLVVYGFQGGDMLMY
jgi:hypothetical protein